MALTAPGIQHPLAVPKNLTSSDARDPDLLPVSTGKGIAIPHLSGRAAEGRGRRENCQMDEHDRLVKHRSLSAKAAIGYLKAIRQLVEKDFAM